MRIAFLGLGDIGALMAAHLVREPFDLVVWNRTASKANDFARDHKATVAGTPAEAVKDAEVVITCLPSSVEVEAVLHGENGMLESLPRGAVVIDCTSGDPPTSRSIAAELGGRGVEFIDAPVSGGTTAAKAGTLTVMWGGEESVFERVRPVIEAFGKKIVHAGPVGAGDALKAVNNALLAVHILSAAEGLAVLVKAGVDPRVALEVINASSGRSNSSENLIPQRVLTRAFPRTFRLALLEKDIGIAAVMAEDLGARTPLISLTAERFHEAREKLGEKADHVEAVKMVEEENGIEIK
ncbi:MAG: 3-hydroxyisobutyrate dehydrogenase [Gemmatimonadaceae bacterium]|jgi:3-hydroxyisobutyrate dehydrogenase|nr:3-hydroxyisobutyrate dehydrogenase [Gemmatimonadaceae bacterium]